MPVAEVPDATRPRHRHVAEGDDFATTPTGRWPPLPRRPRRAAVGAAPADEDMADSSRRRFGTRQADAQTPPGDNILAHGLATIVDRPPTHITMAPLGNLPRCLMPATEYIDCKHWLDWRDDRWRVTVGEPPPVGPFLLPYRRFRRYRGRQLSSSWSSNAPSPARLPRVSIMLGRRRALIRIRFVTVR